jgi:membrane-associated phospholipid phosphatase
MVGGYKESTRIEPEILRHSTRPWVRVVAMAVFWVALLAWVRSFGIPNDTLSVFAWLWLGTVAWSVEAPPSHHLHFLRDWWPILVGLVIYFYSRGLADEFGRGAHFQMPITVDRWLGGGTLPTDSLQHALCGNPCDPDSDPRWYDLVLTTVYATHFVTGLSIAAVLWVRSRSEWMRWMRRFVVISFAALVVYIAYPMAPPWLASRQGYLPHGLHRITSRGWADIGLRRVNVILDGVGNPVAAMPSLHAGIALMVAAYAVQRLRSPYRWLLLVYPMLMALALVYFGEHYVIDILAGWLLAGIVLIGCNRWERNRVTDRHS